MPTPTNINTNSTINFSLQGFNSILIGGYFLIGGYLIDKILSHFLVDDSPMLLMSPQIIEILIFLIVFLVLLFSFLAIYFSGKKKAKQQNYILWNSNTKNIFWKYLGVIFVDFSILFYLNYANFIEFITPVFLFLYGFLLFFFLNLTNKNNYLLIGICFLFGFITFLISSYWNSSLLILGIAHIIYGTLKK